MSSIVDDATFPFKPGHQWTQGEIFGGSGGPSPDPIPDNTPAEVKKRLGDILISGAQDALKFLESKVFPASVPNTPGVQAPNGGMGPNTDISIAGRGARFTTAGVVLIVGLALVFVIVIAGRGSHLVKAVE